MSNSRQTLANRKAMCQMKAQIERLELTGHVLEVKQQFSWVAHAKRVMRFGANRSLGSLGPFAAAGRQALGEIMSKNPYAGIAASALLMRISPPVRSSVLKGAAAAVLLAGAVFWFKTRGQRANSQIHSNY